VLNLNATTPLSGYSKAFGDTSLAEAGTLALVSLACPLQGDDDLAKALSGMGLTRPAPGTSTVAGDSRLNWRLIWTAPDQMLLAFPHQTPDAAATIVAETGDAAYLTDQTDSWCALVLNGPLARAALERICPLDLHNDVFAVDAAARTVMEHLGVLIVRTGADAFLLLSVSSSAASFLHAVETSLKNVS
jgi:heterotetrameric sarcosine oxidase gamma subunit